MDAVQRKSNLRKNAQRWETVSPDSPMLDAQIMGSLEQLFYFQVLQEFFLGKAPGSGDQT